MYISRARIAFNACYGRGLDAQIIIKVPSHYHSVFTPNTRGFRPFPASFLTVLARK